jgi:hypothetical protein
VLFRLAYVGVTNALAMLRLLPTSDRAKDAEILALRHQITILKRQLNGQRIQFTPADRALLAALLHRLPRTVLRQIPLLMRVGADNDVRPAHGSLTTTTRSCLTDVGGPAVALIGASRPRFANGACGVGARLPC